MIRIVEKNNLSVGKIKMKADYELSDCMCKPLDSFKSGFMLIINGPSGSGKTNMLVNLLNKNKCKLTKKRQSFKGCFHNIYICSPSLHTLDNPVFNDLDTKYDTFDEDFIDMYLDTMETQKDEQDDDDEPILNLLILDDVADDIKDKTVFKKFTKLINTRRHCNTSIIILSQNIIQLPPIIRKNISHLITFQLKQISEEEHIYSMTKQPKSLMRGFFDSIFDAPFNFLYIDLTLKTGKIQFYKNWNKIAFN